MHLLEFAEHLKKLKSFAEVLCELRSITAEFMRMTPKIVNENSNHSKILGYLNGSPRFTLHKHIENSCGDSPQIHGKQHDVCTSRFSLAITFDTKYKYLSMLTQYFDPNHE